ncbi:MAG: hypothetical protein FWD53_13120, partial [Phycisphaerales bacterium]|nr:hypothetical protein [Phycisphaerales bacterium]
ITPQEIEVHAHDSATVNSTLTTLSARHLQTANTLSVAVDVPQRPAQLAAPVSLVGAHRVCISTPVTLPGESAYQKIHEHVFEQETLQADLLTLDARPGSWRIHHHLDNDMVLRFVPNNHAIYVRAFLYSPVARKVRLCVHTSGSVKIWFNHMLVCDKIDPARFRPSLAGGFDPAFLVPGYNEILIKLTCRTEERGGGLEAHFCLSDPTNLNAGITDLLWTRFPWD